MSTSTLCPGSCVLLDSSFVSFTGRLVGEGRGVAVTFERYILSRQMANCDWLFPCPICRPIHSVSVANATGLEVSQCSGILVVSKLVQLYYSGKLKITHAEIIDLLKQLNLCPCINCHTLWLSALPSGW